MPSQCISHPVACSHPPPIYLLGFHHLVFSPSCFPPIFPLCMAAFLIEGFCCRYPHLCVCQRNMCCLILHCRIAELSCLLNLLTTLDYFIPALFITSSHTHTALSFILITLVSFLLGPGFSPHTICARAHSLHERREPFTVQLFQYVQALSHFPPIDDNFIPPPSTVSPPHQCHSLV